MRCLKLLLLLSLWPCAAAFSQTAPPTFEVKYKGEMRKVMREGDLRGTVSLDTLLRKKHVYALGPLEDLQGEILILDGKPYISQIRGNKVVVDTTAQHKAAFLVYAQVKKWAVTEVPVHIRDQESLEAFVKETAKAAGYNVKEAFPFLLRGPVNDLQLHVMNKPAAASYAFEAHDQFKARYPITNAEVEILGFYSTKHQGIFTHHDSNTHLHVITPDRSLTGHLDSFVPRPGQLKLYLPYLPEAARKKPVRVSVRKSTEPYR